MSNRVNVDLSINAQGYEQDLNKATQATAAYETETRKVADATVSFNKEMRAAKKAAFDLAGGYAQLSKEEKESSFGQEMKRQLDEAMEKAAEFVDMQGDLRQQMKNMASDTRVLDTMSEGFGVIADTASTALGAIAQFTGREEDARRAVVAFTTAQSALGAMTKIQNALQKQSNTMMAISKVQTLAAAAAAKMKTAAEGKGIITTKAATAAQAAFNAVAKANPYVLLATAIAGAIGVVSAYIAITKKSEEAEKIKQEALERSKEAQEAYTNTYNSTVTSLISSYMKLKAGWEQCHDALSKTQYIKENKSELEKLDLAVKNVNDAERIFNQNTKVIIEGFKKRARAAALAAKAEKVYQQSLEKNDKIIELENKRSEELSKVSVDPKNKISTGGLAPGYNAENERAAIENRKKAINDKYDALIAAEKAGQKKLEDEADALWREFIKEESHGTPHLKDVKTNTTTTKHTTEEIKAAKDSLADYEKQLSDLQEKAKKGVLPKELQDPEKYAAKIQELQDKIKELKIKWGFEKPQTLEQKLEEQLSQARTKYELAIEADDQQAIDAAKELYIAAFNELESHKLKLKLDKPVTDEDRRKIQEEVTKIVNTAINPDISIDWDFSDLPDAMQKAADKTIDQYNRITDAVKELQEKMAETKDPASIEIYKSALEKLEPTLKSTSSEMQHYQEISDERSTQKKQAEEMNKRNEALGSYIDMINATSNALGALGDSEAAQMAQFTLNTAATVANAIKTIAAMHAEALAAGTASGAKLPFPANIAAIATIVGAVASIFASLPKFAHGGVVGGNSTVGDKLLARVNSKETILTQKQASNALDLMDSKAVGVTNVVGKIKGTDIILVAQNVSKEMKKSGKNITFG